MASSGLSGVTTRNQARIVQTGAMDAKETHSDAIVRVSTIIGDMKEKSIKLISDSTADKRDVKKFFDDKQKEISDEIDRMRGAFEEIVNKNDVNSGMDELLALQKEVAEAQRLSGIGSLVGLVTAYKDSESMVNRLKKEWEDAKNEYGLKGDDWTQAFHSIDDEMKHLRSDIQDIETKYGVDNREEMNNKIQMLLDSEAELKEKLAISEQLVDDLTQKISNLESINSTGTSGAIEVLDTRSDFEKEVEKRLQRLEEERQILKLESDKAFKQKSANARVNSVIGMKVSTIKNDEIGSDELTTICRNVKMEDDSDIEDEEDEWEGMKGQLGKELPPLPKYGGKREDWDEFLEGFLIRFGKRDNIVAMTLLKEHLILDAKEAFKAIPKADKDKGLKSSLRWLEGRLSGKSKYEKLEVEKKVKQQTIGNRAVVTVCEELEKWTARLFAKNVEMMEEKRRHQMLDLFQGRKEEYKELLTMFEMDKDYQQMKDAMIRIEYINKMASG